MPLPHNLTKSLSTASRAQDSLPDPAKIEFDAGQGTLRMGPMDRAVIDIIYTSDIVVVTHSQNQKSFRSRELGPAIVLGFFLPPTNPKVVSFWSF